MSEHKVNVEELSPEDMLDLARQLMQAATKAKNKRKAKRVREKDHGSPRDPAVKILARIGLEELYNKRDLSYREIGSLVGVSHERIRQLHHEFAELSDKVYDEELRFQQTA